MRAFILSAFVSAAALIAPPPAFASEGGGGGAEMGGGVIRPNAAPAPRAAPAARARPAPAAREAQPAARPAAPRAAAPARTAPTPPVAAGPARARPPAAGETRYVADEALVLMARNATPAQIAQFEQRQNLTRLGAENLSLLGAPLHRYRIGGGRTVGQALAAMRSERVAALAQPNYVFALQQQTAAVPADAPLPQFAIEKLRLRAAHRTAKGASVAVAVIDSRIDADHPELAGAIRSRFEATDDTSAGPHPHGTAIAGVIAARQKLLGAAPGVDILAAAAFEAGAGGAPANGTTWRILRSLDWAVGAGARVANLSFAGPQDPLLGQTLAEAHKRGVALVAASGNAGPRAPAQYPASDRHVIAVTATDARDGLYALASGGRHVGLAAPGVEILTTAPKAGYDLTSGTSIAAAYVSGVAALMLEAKPKLTPNELAQTLRRTARAAAAGAKPLDYRFVDAEAAVNGTPVAAVR